MTTTTVETLRAVNDEITNWSNAIEGFPYCVSYVGEVDEQSLVLDGHFRVVDVLALADILRKLT